MGIPSGCFGLEIDIKKLKEKNGFDLTQYPPYFLILTGWLYGRCLISPNNRYGQLLGIIFALPTEVNNKLLSHDYYRLIALAGAKGIPFIMSTHYEGMEFIEKMSKSLSISRIHRVCFI